MTVPLQQAEEIIHKLEGDFPVESLEYKGLRVWPYIRIFLFYSLLKSESFFHQNRVSAFKRIRKQLFIVLDSWLGISGRAKPLRKLKTKDFLFFSEDKTRNFVFEDQHFHIYEEGWKSLVREKGTYATVEFVQQPQKKVPDSNLYFMNGLLVKAFVKRFLKQLFNKSRNEIQGWSDFTTVLEKKGISFSLTHDSLKKKLDMLLIRSEYATKILKKTNPKAIFFVAYFSGLILPFVLAAKRLEIRTVELQHGFWSVNNRYAALPQKSYELLPSDYWGWGSSTKTDMPLLNKHPDYHITGTGSPWIELWKDQDSHWFKQAANSCPDGLFNPGSKNIMVALQPEKEPLPVHLLEAIKLSNENYHWYFRLHPFMLNRKEEVEAILKNPGNIHFEIDHSSSLPLYFILQKMDVLITMWSTVAYEAANFGVIPVIIHPTGKKYMAKEIDEGKFHYADTTDKIIEAISDLPIEKQSIQTDFFETNKQLIEEETERFFRSLG